MTCDIDDYLSVIRRAKQLIDKRWLIIAIYHESFLYAIIYLSVV